MEYVFVKNVIVDTCSDESELLRAITIKDRIITIEMIESELLTKLPVEFV